MNTEEKRRLLSRRLEETERALREEVEMLAQTNATLRDLKANWREYVEKPSPPTVMS